MYTFGPIPSRRLGRSLGINNIPPKICTYACVYCQLGRTIKMQIDRQKFFEPKDIYKSVKNKIDNARERLEVIDYLTFVPDGEPTLDINLGKEIILLKSFGIKIAVITNSSLIWDENVREDLMNADWISVKVDSTDEEIWRKVDRPHGKLDFDKISVGLQEFAKEYKGELVTETMLVYGINDSNKSLSATAEFISSLKPSTSYISIPTRPPAADWVSTPSSITLNKAYQIFQSSLTNIELITGYEGNTFAFSGDLENDILSITSVHPMRKDAVEQFVIKSNSDWSEIQKLIEKKQLLEIEYQNNTFYLRNFNSEK
jgi:wyosine [tRNA(Phe)-imidazoG37] synthetase (radical SAM superfamily)